MPYTGKVYRPPSEARSLILQATTGCPYNRCNFCSMYSDEDFTIKSLAGFKEHIQAVKQFHRGPVESVFLADGNTIIIKTEQLLEFLETIREEFPKVERITSYGSARYVNKKSAEELKSLREAGLARIHTGMESGDADTLELINKGTTPEEIIAAGKKVKEAGIELSQYYLVGVGGQDLSEQHAVNSAKVLNQFDPEFIRLRTFIPIDGTKLHDLCQQGEFKLLNGHQALAETRVFIENLEVSSNLLSDHISNHWDINGQLPDEKAEMLAEINKALKVDISKFRDPTRGHL